MRDYKKLLVWKKSHELVLSIYRTLIPTLPREEKYRITDQIKRAAYSIPLNIVEGCGRSGQKDFVRFLDYSLGSIHELEYLLILTNDLEYINNTDFENVKKELGEIKAMLIVFIKYHRTDRK